MAIERQKDNFFKNFFSHLKEKNYYFWELKEVIIYILFFLLLLVNKYLMLFVFNLISFYLYDKMAKCLNDEKKQNICIIYFAISSFIFSYLLTTNINKIFVFWTIALAIMLDTLFFVFKKILFKKYNTALINTFLLLFTIIISILFSLFFKGKTSIFIIFNVLLLFTIILSRYIFKKYKSIAISNRYVLKGFIYTSLINLLLIVFNVFKLL